MKVADAHCDTLTRFKDNPLITYNPFSTEEAHWTIAKFHSQGGVLQYMAIMAEPELSGDAAMRFAVQYIGRFLSNKPEIINLLEKRADFDEDKINIILALEGASPVINDLYNLHAFHKLGVRAITLTWNHRNFVGDGVGLETEYGLTPFGLDLIREMEKLNMIVDVSHLNLAGFNDVAKHSTKPFIASHSNCNSIHQHKRNLNDEQIQEIVHRGGFIGLNLYSSFLGNENDDLTQKIIDNVAHFIELGAEKSLGLGADFDGIDQCPFADVSGYSEIYHILKHKMTLDDGLIEGIMHKNLIDFTLKAIG